MDEQAFRNLVERDLHKKATAEEEAYLTSDLEVVRAWEQYLDAIRQETYSALSEIAADIAGAKAQGREFEPFLRKRAGVNRFQAVLTTRMVFVQSVRSRLEEEEKQRRAEEEEQKRVAKEAAREEAKQKRVEQDTQRIAEAKERRQVAKEQRRQAHEQRVAEAAQRKKEKQSQKEAKEKRRQFVVGYRMALKHLQDLMEYHHIPFEEAFALQWKCLNEQYTPWKDDEAQNNDTDGLFWRYAREQVGDRLR